MVKMSVKDIETAFSLVDACFATEAYNYGKATYNIRYLRHYYLKRLLDLQLKEFNHA